MPNKTIVNNDNINNNKEEKFKFALDLICKIAIRILQDKRICKK